MAAFTEKDKTTIQNAFDELLGYYSETNPQGNIELIKKAFNLANGAHDGMRRRSGEPYVMHPIAVASIVAKEIGLGATSISAALLHDVVEDTDFTVENIAERFSDTIAKIVEGLTKLKTVTEKREVDSSMQAENFRKLLLTMSEDFRVVLIKIADRLHNMRTLESMPTRKQYKIAGETLYVYAPLAHRLGLFNIKTELENLAFRYEHPEQYHEVEKKIADSAKLRHDLFEQLTQPIEKRLHELDVDFVIKERIKSVYSVWNKMKKKQVPFEEIYDITAIRIIFKPSLETNENMQCWKIHSAVTEVHKPHPNRLRNWLALPKTNGYKALHDTVMGPQGRWFEIQIRSERMNEIAEKGYAAHWKYKGGHKGENETELEKWIRDIREHLERSGGSSAIEFVDDFKRNLFSEEITVFTPKGDMHTLPVGASALDFAFNIHTELGIHCIGAKINNKLESISYILQNGDQVEILTSKKQKPQLSWNKMVVTGRAKIGLKEALKEKIKATRKHGMELLENELHKHRLSTNPDILSKLLRYYEMSAKEELFSAIGEGSNTLDDLSNALNTSRKEKMMPIWKLRIFNLRKSNEDTAAKSKVSTNNILNENCIPAKCCHPLPGDDVLGLMGGDNVIVHRRDCKKAIEQSARQGENIVDVKWTSESQMVFLSQIKIEGFDRMGMVNDISKVIYVEKGLNIRQFHFNAHDGVFDGFISLYVHDRQSVNNLVDEMSKIKGIDTVVRVE